MKADHWIAIGASWAAIAVGLGAAGAHGLREQLVQSGHLANWQTAVEYQMWHAFALLLVGALARGQRGRFLIAWAFLLGSACFSGSLYLLSFDIGGGMVWPLTPLGGVLLLVAWVSFAVQALRGTTGANPGA